MANLKMPLFSKIGQLMEINVFSVWNVRYKKVLNFKVRPPSRTTGFVLLVRSLIQSLDHCFPFL